MKKLILISALILSHLVGLTQTSSFFMDADAFFAKNVHSGLVNYKGIKENPAELKKLVNAIGSFSLSGADKSTQKAFLINAYNLLVIRNVVDHYPVARPTDIPGFFDVAKFNLAGAQLTLSDIENKKIRPTFKDPRIHFALVCAAMSCPPIANCAFTPMNVESKLEAITKDALNNNGFIKVSTDNRTVQFSRILDWYKDDFLAASKSVLDYVNQYRKTPIPLNFKQSFYEYDWSLNAIM
jgi:Protein of unknown function, DUF547